MSDNIFETATRQGFRYPSVRGQLTTEQLWDLPLTSKTGLSLDEVAKAVNAELKNVTEESFVATAVNPAKTALATKLELVKHIIAVKISDAAAARSKAEKKAEKERLLEILATKKDEGLLALSEEELLARIGALD